jgi:hypothetical protein
LFGRRNRNSENPSRLEQTLAALDDGFPVRDMRQKFFLHVNDQQPAPRGGKEFVMPDGARFLVHGSLTACL